MVSGFRVRVKGHVLKARLVTCPSLCYFVFTMYDKAVIDIAEAFKVTEETVRRWARSGKIESVKLPGLHGKGEYRFSEKEIKGFEDKYYSRSKQVYSNMVEPN